MSKTAERGAVKDEDEDGEIPTPSLESTPYQRLPPLDAETRASLKADIRENGVREPVKVDEEGRIIDGHHRVEICEELGIDDIPVEVIEGLSEAEKYRHAIKYNVQRRNLEQGGKQELLEDFLAERWDGDTSGEWREDLARDFATSTSTVGRAYTGLKKSGKLSHLGIFSKSDKRQQVREYLRENPDASNREVADAIEADVSHATVGNWGNEWDEKRKRRERHLRGEDVPEPDDEPEPEPETETEPDEDPELIDVPKVADPDGDSDGLHPADPVDLDVPSHRDGETGDAADEQVFSRPYTDSTLVNIGDLDMGLDEVRKSNEHVYIGSESGDDIRTALPGDDGWLANPHEQQDMHPECARTAYRIHFNEKVDGHLRFRKDLEAIEGKTLVCHCTPGACHGEVILDYLDEKAREKELKPLRATLEPIEGVGEKTAVTIHEEIGDLEFVADTTPDLIDGMNIGIGRDLAEEIIDAAEEAVTPGTKP